MQHFTIELYSEETQFTSEKYEAETVQDVIDFFEAQGYEVLCVTDSEGQQYGN